MQPGISGCTRLTILPTLCCRVGAMSRLRLWSKKSLKLKRFSRITTPVATFWRSCPRVTQRNAEAGQKPLHLSVTEENTRNQPRVDAVIATPGFGVVLEELGSDPSS